VSLESRVAIGEGRLFVTRAEAFEGVRTGLSVIISSGRRSTTGSNFFVCCPSPNEGKFSGRPRESSGGVGSDQSRLIVLSPDWACLDAADCDIELPVGRLDLCQLFGPVIQDASQIALVT
jgi:hypothetical protein